MREIFIMMLSIIAIFAILYPIRPGWKKRILREDYAGLHAPVDKTIVIQQEFPSGCDKACQNIITGANANDARLKADSKYDTVAVEHIQK